MTPSEIRAKETKELKKIVEEKRTAMFGLKLQQVTGQLAKVADLGKTRKDIARMLTIARERELGLRAMDHGQRTEETTKKKIGSTKTKTMAKTTKAKTKKAKK